MKVRPPVSPKPSEAELRILHVLWASDGCTVRDVHQVLHADDGTGYTTALKFLQVMHAKGLVKRDDSLRAHVYRAAVTKERTQKKFLMDLVQRVFEGSSSQLVLHALGSQRASPDELREIRTLLNKLDTEAPSNDISTKKALVKDTPEMPDACMPGKDIHKKDAS